MSAREPTLSVGWPIATLFAGPQKHLFAARNLARRQLNSAAYSFCLCVHPAWLAMLALDVNCNLVLPLACSLACQLACHYLRSSSRWWFVFGQNPKPNVTHNNAQRAGTGLKLDILHALCPYVGGSTAMSCQVRIDLRDASIRVDAIRSIRTGSGAERLCCIARLESVKLGARSIASLASPLTS